VDGSPSWCPTPDLDTDGDTIVAINEGGPAYGPVRVNLTVVTADETGSAALNMTLLDLSEFPTLEELSSLVMVIHGLEIDDEYDDSVPVGCGLVAGSTTTFTADLSGASEVPPVETDASGFFIARLNPAGTILTWQLNVANIDNVVAAHIHEGAADATGGVLVPLFFTEAAPVSGTTQLWSGAFNEDDMPDGLTLAGLLAQMMAGDTYVNVHTAANAAGEIRGQVMTIE
jgi:hypothetical protein